MLATHDAPSCPRKKSMLMPRTTRHEHDAGVVNRELDCDDVDVDATGSLIEQPASKFGASLRHVDR
jgi:hypothetical protein